MGSQTTRVFMNGNSQAVRIPAEFRLATDRVEISRNEHGDLVIHPLAEPRGAALLRALENFDPKFADTLAAERVNESGEQEREPL